MANISSTQQARQLVADEHQEGHIRSGEEQPSSSRPVELLEVGKDHHGEDNEIVYPSGIKVWLAIAALYMAYFVNGLVCV